MSTSEEVVEVKNEDLLEETSRQFIENVDKLEDLSRKVSREGLRKIFLATTRFPYAGDNFKVNNVHESELLKQALFIKALADQITKLQPVEESEVVDKMVEQVLEGGQ